MKNSFFKKLTALLLGTIMVLSMIPAIAISTKAAETSVTYSFTSLTGKGSKLNSGSTLVSTLNKCGPTGTSHVTAATATNIYDGNGSGGKWSSTAGFLKFGKSGGDGVLALTFDTNVVKVDIVCYAWGDGKTDTIKVNECSAVVAPNSGTWGTKTFEFAATKTVTITTNDRAFVQSITVYFEAAGACEHTYDSCEDTTCNLCNEERTAPGHIYDNCEDTECNNCTTGTRDALEHEYTNEFDASCNSCSAVRAVTLPEADSTITIEVANKLGLAHDNNTYTTDKYYVTGEITKVDNDTYGNIYIKDENGTEFYVYGVYSWDKANRYDALADKPVVGDTITLYGVIGTYDGVKAQMKDSWIYVEAADCEHTYANEFDASCDICGEERDVTIPAADSILDYLTITKLGIAQGHDSYTEGKYYFIGFVKEITNTTYGNVTLVDKDGNEFTVYGTYDATGENRFDEMANQFKVGDRVQVYGNVGQYGGKAQIKNGWVTILPKFEGFGLTLNKGITIRVKLTINAEWIANNPDAKVIFTDALGTQLDPIAGTNYYSITLTPGDIDRNIKVSYCDINEDVRVENYIAKAREQYADDEALMLLLDAITAYGQAANGEIVSAPDFSGVDAPTYDDDINLFGGNLTLDAVLNDYANIGIAVNATENLSYTISLAGKYASKGDDLAAIVTDGKLVIENLRPANFNDEIVLTVTNAEGNTATATFTFNEYLKALYDIGNEYQNMAAATYNYGVAVEAYVAATVAQQ